MTRFQPQPNWYSPEDDTAWQRVKHAFQRDWQQTKHDLGGEEPDLGQSASDTVAQATGSKPIPSNSIPVTVTGDEYDDVFDENDETAYRYGFAAYRHLGGEWNTATIERLRKDWGDDADWEQNCAAVRQGWFYAKNQETESAISNPATSIE